MWRSIFFIFAILLVSRLKAQPNLIPFFNGKYWGYCDTARVIKIQPKYKELPGIFDVNGLAKVRNQYTMLGLIDTLGNEVIPCVYKDLYFTTPYFVVMRNYRWHDSIEPYSLLNYGGEKIVPFTFLNVQFDRTDSQNIVLMSKNVLFFYNINFEKKITKLFDTVVIRNVQHMYSMFSDSLNHQVLRVNGRYFNFEGQELQESSISKKQLFSTYQGATILRIKRLKHLQDLDFIIVKNINGKYGCLTDSLGVKFTRIPVIYDSLILEEHYGHAIVKLNGKWGAVDRFNKVIVPFKEGFLAQGYKDKIIYGDTAMVMALIKDRKFYLYSNSLTIPEIGCERVNADQFNMRYYRDQYVGAVFSVKHKLVHIPCRYYEIGGPILIGKTVYVLVKYSASTYGFVREDGKEFFDR